MHLGRPSASMSFRSASDNSTLYDKKKRGHKGSPLRKNLHPASLLHQKLGVKNQIFISTPNMARKKTEKKELMKVRRAYSESEFFMHSWDYSPIIVPSSGKNKITKFIFYIYVYNINKIGSKKKKKRRKRTEQKPDAKKLKKRKKNSNKSTSNSSLPIQIPKSIPTSRKSSLENIKQRGGRVLTPKKRRRSVLVHSKGPPPENQLRSSEPEELDICDHDEEEDEYVINEDIIFSGPKIDESSPRTLSNKRSHSFSDLSNALKDSAVMSFDEHRDQFERLWQASQMGQISFQESESISYDKSLKSKVSSGTLPHLINKLIDEKQKSKFLI